MKQSFCHCKERSEEADNIFVIASLNAEAFRRGNLLFWGRDYDIFHKIRDWLSPTHSPTLLGWITRLAFANTVRTPLVCKPRLRASLTGGSQWQRGYHCEERSDETISIQENQSILVLTRRLAVEKGTSIKQ